MTDKKKLYGQMANELKSALRHVCNVHITHANNFKGLVPEEAKKLDVIAKQIDAVMFEFSTKSKEDKNETI